MILPPPCLTVGLTCLDLTVSPSRIQAQVRPSELKRFIFVSSDQITRFQSSNVQCAWALHQASLFPTFFWLSMGFFFFSSEPNPAFLKALRTVSGLTLIPWSISKVFATFTALSKRSFVALRTQYLSSTSDNTLGRPPLLLSIWEQTSFRTLET